MSSLMNFGRVNGISKIGDLLRQYMFPWLAFYAAEGTPSDKVLFITVASLVQALPSLTLGNYSARVVRRFSPRATSLWSNAGMGIVVLLTAIAVYNGLHNKAVVLTAWLLVGTLEVLYYPSRDCLYAALAGSNDRERAAANSAAAFTYQVGRAFISLVMLGVVCLIGPVPDEVPRAILAAALCVDAFSFGVVVLFLCLLHEVPKLREEPTESSNRISVLQAASVRGAVPVFLCVLMLWAFAYSSFYFVFEFYQELEADTQLRQASFYLAMFASACGGFFGAKIWKLNLPALGLGMLTVCFVEATVAFMPRDWFWGTAWICVISFLSILVYTSVFDGMIPQLVQGLDKNAEVSSTINMVKEGLSPVIVVGIAALANYCNAPREILVGACALSAFVVLTTLVVRKSAIEDVIKASISEKV